MKRPPGWLIALTASIFLCVCGGCLVGGIKLRGAGAGQIDREISAMVSAEIAGNSVTGGLIRINESDLDINNEMRMFEAGIETGTNGASIYGFQTRIAPDGIVIDTPGSSFMHVETRPSVKNGRIELQNDQSWKSFLSVTGFGKGIISGIENGINDALERRGLKPLSVTLYDGIMVVTTEPS
jgi:hypothetical protein